MTHTHQVNNNPVEVLVHNTYDALGQLVTKQVGGDETYVQNIGHLQTVDYQYNIRGWLKQINDVEDLTTTNDLFAFKINYDTPEVYGTTPLYNGNISETIWKTSSDNIHRGYGYEYDKLNRLTNAYFGTNHQINNHFNEHLSYDKNGNITTLQRTGNVDGFEQVIDDLTYDYIGNQLQSVTDADHGNQYFGFVDGNQQGDDYKYDMFGNMIQDLNKEIEEIKYNHLNLPIRIRFANGGEINYLYDAMGVKVRKFVHEQGYNESVTDYLNGFQYSNEILQFFPHTEGYVQYYQEGEENGNTNQGNDGAPLQEGFSYVYQYKDHLGNNRVNYTLNREGTLSILSEDHYYPFGMKHPYNNDRREWAFIRIENIPTPFVRQVPNSGYQYKYNGKEWQDELNLNLYDYGARNYDPAIGRWMNIDPLAENSRRWTPYNYAYNNPIYFVDPDGMQSQEFNGSSAFTLSSGGFSEDAEVDTMVDMGYGRVVSSRHLTGAVNFSGGDLKITGGGKPKKKSQESSEFNNNNNKIIGSEIRQPEVCINLLTPAGLTPTAEGNLETFGDIASANNIIGSVFTLFISNKIINYSRVLDLDVGSWRIKEVAEQGLQIRKIGLGVFQRLGYFGAGISALQGNYFKGGVEFSTTLLFSKIKYTPYGIAWSTGWYGGELLSRTETYNNLLFGKGSAVYMERGAKYGWYSPPTTVGIIQQIEMVNNWQQGN